MPFSEEQDMFDLAETKRKWHFYGFIKQHTTLTATL